MSLGEAEAKFPNQEGLALPPSPSRENPGQVYPKSDPTAAAPSSIPGTGGSSQPSTNVGNPYLIQDAFSKLDHALSTVIGIFENEESTVGASASETSLVNKFKGWRNELQGIHRNERSSSTGRVEPDQEGGMFTD